MVHLRAVGIALTLVLASVIGVGVGVAHANNSHQIGNWSHGLGDGTDNDSYLHPFMHNTQGHSVYTRLILARNVWLSHEGICAEQIKYDLTVKHYHHHTNWDTGTDRESRYSASMKASGYGDNFLNFHTHRHHYFQC